MSERAPFRKHAFDEAQLCFGNYFWALSESGASISWLQGCCVYNIQWHRTVVDDSSVMICINNWSNDWKPPFSAYNNIHVSFLLPVMKRNVENSEQFLSIKFLIKTSMFNWEQTQSNITKTSFLVDYRLFPVYSGAGIHLGISVSEHLCQSIPPHWWINC